MSLEVASTRRENAGYLGIIHRDGAFADDKALLTEYIAGFKHAMLFTPTVVLADHMMFSPNFERAYRKDEGFRDLLRAGLTDVAYFEKYNNGRVFPLVEHRKFREFLRRKRDPRYDPRIPECPGDPFDAELEAIQARAGSRVPDAKWRDPIFTRFAAQELDNGTLKPVLGKLYTAYETAFRRMSEDLAARNAPLGIVHFDEKHKAPGNDNIFDYMARVGSLGTIPRERLVSEFAGAIAHAHRVLLIKAEMCLMRDVHAVLPSELRAYRTLALSDSASGTIDEREAQLKTLDLDLSAVSVDVVASLSAAEIVEVRKAAGDFFEVLRDGAGNPGSFGVICSTLADYLKRLNAQLAYKAVPARRPGPVKAMVKIAQGKIARHTALLDDAVAVMFRIAGAFAHSYYKHHVAIEGGDAALDVPLKEMETFATAAIAPSALERSINDIPAHLSLSPGGEQVMQYE